MRTSYTAFNNKFSVESSHDAAFLSGRKGFFFLPLKGSWSKYQGWHIHPENANGENGEEGSPFKVLDFIGAIEAPSPDPAQSQSISVSSKWLKKKTRAFEEEYSISPGKMTYSILLKGDASPKISLHLDPREINSFPEFGRIFEVKDKGNGVFMTAYRQFSDSSLTQRQKEIFIALKFEGIDVRPLSAWIKKDYPFDQARGSRSSCYVFEPFLLQVGPGKKEAGMTIAVGNSEEEALSAISGKEQEKESGKEPDLPLKIQDSFLDGMSPFMKKAFLLAAQSFLSLQGVPETGHIGMRAGLPWFFQFWTRDELISLLGLSALGRDAETERMVSHLMEKSRDSGVFPAFLPSGGLNSIDAPGLLFWQCLSILNNDTQTTNPTRDTLLEWRNALEAMLAKIESSRQKGLLIYAGSLETWMDTSFGNDARQGACIELQALHATMHECLAKINEMVSEAGRAGHHREMQHQIERKVRDSFFREAKLADTILNDGTADFTQRPNIFLAYLLHPSLLSRDEWRSAFDSALPELWLEWGGLASISKKHPLYCAEYTGEDNRSYHRGDSWIFVNNIAAHAMHEVDRKAYYKFIAMTLEASTELLLSRGVAGALPELSSASSLSPKGCPVQAWSLATYIFLLQELKGDGAFEEIFKKAMEQAG